MTTHEIDLRPVPVNRETGEVLDLHDAEQMTLAAREHPEALADFLDHLDAAIREAQSIREEVASYLVERMDKDATQTLHAGRYTVTVNGSSDEYEKHDAEKIRAGLLGLVATGVLSEAALEKAVRTKYEASKAGLKSLAALRNEDVDAIIQDATEIAIRKRRATVKRA